MGYKFESLDTSILVRLVTRDDPKLADQISAYLQEKIMWRKFFIDDLAFTELAYVLERQQKVSRQDIVSALNFLLNDAAFVTNIRVQQALDFYAVHPKLSFNDCYLAVKAEEEEATPLWTLDRKLAKQHPAAKEFKY